MKVIQSNESDIVGKEFVFNFKKDIVQFGSHGFLKFKSVLDFPCDSVLEVKELDNQHNSAGTKSMLGTVGGAAVGGLLTGGIGAIVGGMASGNNVEKSSLTRIGIKFDEGTWAVIEVDTSSSTMVGRLNKGTVEAVFKKFSSKTICPF